MALVRCLFCPGLIRLAAVDRGEIGLALRVHLRQHDVYTVER